MPKKSEAKKKAIPQVKFGCGHEWPSGGFQSTDGFEKRDCPDCCKKAGKSFGNREKIVVSRPKEMRSLVYPIGTSIEMNLMEGGIWVGNLQTAKGHLIASAPGRRRLLDALDREYLKLNEGSICEVNAKDGPQ